MRARRSGADTRRGEESEKMKTYKIYALNPDRRFHKDEEKFIDAEIQATHLVEKLGYPHAEVWEYDDEKTDDAGVPVFGVWLTATNRVESGYKNGWTPP
jgi:hypothetical protein